jgi:hypothetical protein
LRPPYLVPLPLETSQSASFHRNRSFRSIWICRLCIGSLPWPCRLPDLRKCT